MMTATSFPFARAGLARDARGWFGRFAALGSICLAHAALLAWLAMAQGVPPVVVSPPSVIGELVSDTPAPEAPKPLPMAAPPTPHPKPELKPVVRPKPVPRPPAPKGQPSERAVSVPPAPPPTETPPPPNPPASPVAVDTPPAAPARPGPSEDAPVIPPRSDASALNNPAPEYPRLSRSFHEEGRVLLDVYILPNGTVGQIKLHRSSGYSRLDNAALDAVRRWHYIPAKRGGVPIPYWYVQPIDFELQ